MAAQGGETDLPVLTVAKSWEDLLRGSEKPSLEGVLPRYLVERRWFGGKARTIRSATIAEAIPIPHDSPQAYLTLIRVSYAQGEPEIYRLPLAYLPADQASCLRNVSGAVARVVVGGREKPEEGLLGDAMWVDSFLRSFLEILARDRRDRGSYGELRATPTSAFQKLLQSATSPLEPSVMKAEQSNTSVVYGKLFILKLYRRAERGINPDLEIGRFLTAREFPCIAAVASSLEHLDQDGELSTVALLQRFSPNKGDAWRYTLESLGPYLARALTRHEVIAAETRGSRPLLEIAAEAAPAPARDLIGSYLDDAALLGRRTGELHLALSQDTTDPIFAPDPFTDVYQRGLARSISDLVTSNFALLADRVDSVPAPLRKQARAVLDLQPEITRRVQSLRERRFTCTIIRCHGDYHLGQVLYTGQDFVIIDFEGEPARPLSERRMKGSPVRDVAGMLRSFHYAAYAALMGKAADIQPEDFERLETAARFWYTWVAATYLKAYLETTEHARFLPQSKDELRTLLDVFLLDKAAYELGYELNNRPDWVKIPLEGILQLVQPSG